MAGRGRPRKIAVSAAEAGEIHADNTSVNAEQYRPGGTVNSDVQNTVKIDVGDVGVSGRKEVFLIKTWDDGTIYYIDPDHLDTIDRKRLTRALRRANKSEVELWTVLKDTTLSNSKNALEYFHQVTRTFKPDGANDAPTAAELSNRVKRAEDGLIERGGLSDAGIDAPNSLL